MLHCLLVLEPSLEVPQPRSSMKELAQPRSVVQKHYWVRVLLLVVPYPQQELLVEVVPRCRMVDQVDLEDLEDLVEHWPQVLVDLEDPVGLPKLRMAELQLVVVKV